MNDLPFRHKNPKQIEQMKKDAPAIRSGHDRLLAYVAKVKKELALNTPHHKKRKKLDSGGREGKNV